MTFIKDILGLARTEDPVETPNGNIIHIGEEKTQATVTGEITDDGKYMQFQAYYADIKGEIKELDHLTQEMYFCILVKNGILQKRGSAYIPPEEIYEQMKGKDGLESVGIYRKKSLSKGVTFGFDYENVGDLNKEHKPMIVDALQEVEDLLDQALEEAKEIGEMLKIKHRQDPEKFGKPNIHKKIKALFEVSKKEIMHKYLSC